MSEATGEVQGVAGYLAAVKAMFVSPRLRLGHISGDRAEWRLSAVIAGGAVLLGALLHALIERDLGQGLAAALYLGLMCAFYTAILQLFARWLLQLEISPWQTSTAVNYTMLMAAFVAIPYLSVAAVAYFFVLVFFVLQDLYGTSRPRAIVTLVLFVLAAFVFEALMAKLGLAGGGSH